MSSQVPSRINEMAWLLCFLWLWGSVGTFSPITGVCIGVAVVVHSLLPHKRQPNEPDDSRGWSDWPWQG